MHWESFALNGNASCDDGAAIAARAAMTRSDVQAKGLGGFRRPSGSQPGPKEEWRAGNRVTVDDGSATETPEAGMNPMHPEQGAPEQHPPAQAT
jgi:hypothetical protein